MYIPQPIDKRVEEAIKRRKEWEEFLEGERKKFQYMVNSFIYTPIFLDYAERHPHETYQITVEVLSSSHTSPESVTFCWKNQHGL